MANVQVSSDRVGPWDEVEKNLHANPLPERTRNNERKSNAPASLLDKCEPSNHESKHDKTDDLTW